jgi:sugar O-acyltransferase (sialic acid O-acetyltransferase NeuD family)
MKVAIIGAGGLGKVILEALNSRKEHDVVGFLDDGAKAPFCGLPILGSFSELESLSNQGIEGVSVAVGDRFLIPRLNVLERIGKTRLHSVNAIHSTAWVSPDAKMGRGIYVGPLACVHSSAVVGDYCAIWTNSVIEHDSKLGRNCFICPSVNLAGYGELEANVFVGLGSTIFRVKVGEHATVGGASLVVKDVPANAYVRGHPAEFVRTKKSLSYHAKD